MADEVASLVVRLAMNDASFQQGIQALNREMKLVDSEFKKTISSSAGFGKSLEGLKSKSEYLSNSISTQNKIIDKHNEALKKNETNLSTLTSKQTELKGKVDSAKTAWEMSAKTLGKNAEETQKLKKEYDGLQSQYDKNNNKILTQVKSIDNHNIAINKAQDEVNKFSQELEKNNRAIYNSESAFERFKTSVANIGPKLESIGSSMQKLGTKMSVAITAPMTLMGKQAIKTGMDFEQGMAQVSAISGATGQHLEALEDKARQMGSTTIFSATQASEAMNFMAMAGWSASDMIEGLDGVMNLAAASGEQLSTVSDIVTDALTAFGLSASESGHFADVLASASSNSNTNVAMMGETFKYVAPIAGALGFSIEDTAVAIGLMANAGIKASQAGTSLRQIIMGLQGTVELTGDSFGKWVIETENANGTMRTFEEIIIDLREAFVNMTEAEKAMNAESIAGKVGMSGLLAIVNASEQDFNKLSNAIENSNGVTQEMASTMVNTAQGSLKLLKSALEEASIQLYDRFEPTLRKIIDTMTEWVTKFMELPQWMQNLAINITLLVGALGPLLLIGGTLIKGLGSLIGAFSSLGFLLTPMGATIGVIALAIGGLTTAVAGHAIEQQKLNHELEKTTKLQVEGIEATERSISKATEEMNVVEGKLKAYKQLQQQHSDNISEMDRLEIAIKKAGEAGNYEKVEELTKRYNKLQDETLRLNGTMLESADAFKTQYGSMENAEEQLEAYKTAIAQAEQETKLLEESTGKLTEQHVKEAVALNKSSRETQMLINEYIDLTSKQKLNGQETQRLEQLKNKLIGIFGQSVGSIDKETGQMSINIGMLQDEQTENINLANAKIRAVNAMNEGGVKRVEAQRQETIEVIKLIQKQQKAFEMFGQAGSNPLRDQMFEDRIKTFQTQVGEYDKLIAESSNASIDLIKQEELANQRLGDSAEKAGKKAKEAGDKKSGASKKAKEDKQSELDKAIEVFEKEKELGKISLETELSRLEEIKSKYVKTEDDKIQMNNFAQKQMLENIKLRVQQETITAEEQMALYEQVKQQFCLNEKDKQEFNKLINDSIIQGSKDLTSNLKDLSKQDLYNIKDKLSEQKDLYKDNESVVKEIDKQILETKKEIYKQEVDELKQTVDLLLEERKRQYEEEKLLLDEELQASLQKEQSKLDAIDKAEKEERERKKETKLLEDVSYLESKLSAEQDAKERARISKELHEARIELQEYYDEKERQLQKDSIKQNMENLKKQAKESQDILKQRYDNDVETIKKHQKFQEEVLNQKLVSTNETEEQITRKTIEEINQREKSLLDSMNEQLNIYQRQIPQIESVSHIYGDKLLEGLKSTESMIDSYIAKKVADLESSIQRVNFSGTTMNGVNNGLSQMYQRQIPDSKSVQVMMQQPNMNSMRSMLDINSKTPQTRIVQNQLTQKDFKSITDMINSKGEQSIIIQNMSVNTDNPQDWLNQLKLMTRARGGF